jgi:hypothetical protein
VIASLEAAPRGRRNTDLNHAACTLRHWVVAGLLLGKHDAQGCLVHGRRTATGYSPTTTSGSGLVHVLPCDREPMLQRSEIGIATLIGDDDLTVYQGSGRQARGRSSELWEPRREIAGVATNQADKPVL